MYPFSVSNLSFTGPTFLDMKRLPQQIGIEIFYEWGRERFYREALERILDGRSGKFSIHAPFQLINFSAPCNEQTLFDCLREPFSLYHRFHAEGYVLHTDAPQKLPYSETTAYDCRMRVAERLYRFNEIARNEGVELLVENLCVGDSGHHLFSETQFLELFANNLDLKCIIDIGHAHVQGFDLESILSTLGTRIRAYHLHDNDGRSDTHMPIFTGSFDWKSFAQIATRFTPEAHMVLEYPSPDGLAGMVRDVQEFTQMLKDAQA